MYPPKKESYIGPSTDPFIEDVDDWNNQNNYIIFLHHSFQKLN
jgi:hypothetical protein